MLLWTTKKGFFTTRTFSNSLSGIVTDHQNTVLATTIAGILLVLVYLCPWRIHETGELKWSPIYQPPLSYQERYDPDYGTEEIFRMESRNAEIAYGILALELIAVAAAGGVMYRVTESGGEDDSELRE